MTADPPADDPPAADDAILLADQVAYYRSRAPEYEHWWERTHQYELDAAGKARWDAEVAALEAWVDGLALSGDVLELASGTGIWTRRLARRAHRLTAVDASPEVLSLNRERLDPGSVAVEFVEADLFSWRPERRYDAVFFSFWLSHVPPSKIESFWDLVADALQPSGRAVFIDNRFRTDDWPHVRPESYVQERSDLSSGERYRIVKRYLEPDEVDAELSRLGWRSSTAATERFFVFGTAQRVSPDAKPDLPLGGSAPS